MVEQQTPEWFRRAVGVPAEDRTVVVDGCPIHYLRWGEAGRPGLVLVHGGGAHAHWWSFLAPLFLPQYQVVALDLSGHGDSGHRARYPADTWPREILAVMDDAGLRPRPVLIGHSMGGLVAIVTAALHGDRFAGTIIVDAPVRRPDPESEERRRTQRGFGTVKYHPSAEAALERFRLIPSQPCENDYLVDWVARRSLVASPEGWRWKFDPQVFADRPPRPMMDYLAQVRTRVGLLRGEHSRVVPPETGVFMYELLGRNAPLVEIPAAHHHLLLDQPLAFVAAVRALLADWDHSVPRRSPA